MIRSIDPDNEEVDIDDGEILIPVPDVELDDLEAGELPNLDEDELE